MIIDYKILHVRNNVTCSTNCKYTRAAASYTLKTWFVSSTYMIVHTLHKGDADNNNSNNNIIVVIMKMPVGMDLHSRTKFGG
jgi:hypothetical protein